MVLKQNKYLLCFILFLCFVFQAKAQYGGDTIYSDEVTPVEEETIYQEQNSNTNYAPYYHFSDSEVVNQTLYDTKQKFDKNYWQKETENLTFEEDSIKSKIAKPKPKQSSSFNPASLKYLWLILAAIVLIVVLVNLFNQAQLKNSKVKPTNIVNFDELDEESLKDLELETPLQAALKAKDYKTAYRLKYLNVLKQLIAKNLIFYKKEKTNYEYLMQLNGKLVYEPFRLLTFNFDGIWYGEMPINEEIYNQLDIHFSDFNLKLKNN